MAKQTFTTGQVLTAAQMTSLQQTAMLGGAASAKVASYTLVAADAGSAISMSNASATTITVNTALFAAGDTVQITNLGAGVCTITAGTATVNTSSSLALAQYESGTLNFTSTSAAIFIKGAGAAAGGGSGKVLQVVTGTTTTAVTSTSASFVDTGLTASITPTLSTSKILVILTQNLIITQSAGISNSQLGCFTKLLRGATTIWGSATTESMYFYIGANSQPKEIGGNIALTYLDSPATTSSTTYKTQAALDGSTANNQLNFQYLSAGSQIILMEIGA